MDKNYILLKLTLLLMCSLSLFSCGDSDDEIPKSFSQYFPESDNNGGPSEGLSLPEQKQFVVDVMQDYYLYYDQMPTIDIDNYSSPDAVLSALIVQPDRFSYIGDREFQENFFEEGTYEGLGYARVLNNDQTETITYVYRESAAGRPCPSSTSSEACLRRGDIIVSGSRSGNNVTLNIRRSVDSEIQNLSITLEIGLVQINSVLAASTQNINGLTIGYLALSNFLEPTVAELDIAFASFTENNIDELVLDLRYNGGGRVSVAQTLASYIAGDNGIGSDVARLEWNDQQSDEDSSYPFLSGPNQLNLNQLYVLTLGGTCSASELIINAMIGLSGVDVVTVGQATCGKPVGSVSFNFDDKVLQPITFNVVNDMGIGDYFNGINPTCNAIDDLSANLADPSEGMFAAALFHIANGSCETIATRSTQSRSASSTNNFDPNPLSNQF